MKEIEDIVRRTIASPEIQRRIASVLIDAVAPAAAQLFREEFRGDSLQVPLHMTERERADRDRLVRAAYNGSNINELSERFGISKRQARRIVRPCRRAAEGSTQ